MGIRVNDPADPFKGSNGQDTWMCKGITVEYGIKPRYRLLTRLDIATPVLWIRQVFQ